MNVTDITSQNWSEVRKGIETILNLECYAQIFRNGLIPVILVCLWVSTEPEQSDEVLFHLSLYKLHIHNPKTDTLSDSD